MAHLRGVKRDAWEGGHRVPFITRWPGVTPPGAVCDQLVGLGDLLATCAHMLEVDLPPGQGQDSVSVLPLLQGRIDAPVRNALVHHSASGKFAIRQGDWVFIDAPSGDDNQEPAWFKAERGYKDHDFPGELFDLKDDISEKNNLYGERSRTVQALGRLLDQINPNRTPGTTVQDSAQSE
jgi:arylsulfatase A-like enzyme